VARFSLKRILDAINPFHRETRSAPPPVTPPTTDYRPPEHETQYRRWQREWKEAQIPRKYGNFRKHREMFLDFEFGINIDDEETQNDDWPLYLKYLVKGESEFKRNDPRNPFWQFTGTAPEDFDWSDWRSVMGYARAGDR
jgi:hypothetical protein